MARIRPRLVLAPGSKSSRPVSVKPTETRSLWERPFVRRFTAVDGEMIQPVGTLGKYLAEYALALCLLHTPKVQLDGLKQAGVRHEVEMESAVPNDVRPPPGQFSFKYPEGGPGIDEGLLQGHDAASTVSDMTPWLLKQYLQLCGQPLYRLQAQGLYSLALPFG